MAALFPKPYLWLLPLLFLAYLLSFLCLTGFLHLLLCLRPSWKSFLVVAGTRS
jgi:hypothetical protein